MQGSHFAALSLLHNTEKIEFGYKDKMLSILFLGT